MITVSNAVFEVIDSEQRGLIPSRLLLSKCDYGEERAVVPSWGPLAGQKVSAAPPRFLRLPYRCHYAEGAYLLPEEAIAFHGMPEELARKIFFGRKDPQGSLAQFLAQISAGSAVPPFSMGVGGPWLVGVESGPLKLVVYGLKEVEKVKEFLAQGGYCTYDDKKAVIAKKSWMSDEAFRSLLERKRDVGVVAGIRFRLQGVIPRGEGSFGPYSRGFLRGWPREQGGIMKRKQGLSDAEEAKLVVSREGFKGGARVLDDELGELFPAVYLLKGDADELVIYDQDLAGSLRSGDLVDFRGRLEVFEREGQRLRRILIGGRDDYVKFPASGRRAYNLVAGRVVKGEGMSSVLMLTWEYPPRVVGGISSHVRDLSAAIAERGNLVHVITPEFPDAPSEEVKRVGDGEVRVHRVQAYDRPAPNFTTWISFMNQSMEERAISLFRDEGYGLIHAHDWVVAESAIGLKHLSRLPLVATIHATERGRRGGIFSQLSAHIDQEERWLVGEAWDVIACSWSMVGQVQELGAPRDKVFMIPNGVWPEQFEVRAGADFRRRFASDDERLVLFVGRLVHEKGLLELLKAFAYLSVNFRAKLVVVGEGYLKQEIYDEATRLGIQDKLFMTGFVDDDTKKKLLSVADVLVVPSLYEPFGIVALEGMAAGVPVVVSSVGGLKEVVQHGVNGVTVYPGDPSSIAWGLAYVLSGPGRASAMAERAKKEVCEKYSWDRIAHNTLSVYEKVLSEYEKSGWKPRDRPVRHFRLATPPRTKARPG